MPHPTMGSAMPAAAPTRNIFGIRPARVAAGRRIAIRNLVMMRRVREQA